MKIKRAPQKKIRRAFTLLEVMFATVAFCTASFAILALVSTSLRSARMLQQPMVDAGEVAGQLSQTNSLVEGEESDNLSDLLGKEYQDYDWTYDIREVQTNKLFQVDFIVQRDSGGQPVVAKMSILLFRPQSPAGSLDGATTR
ncbi:MAG: type II secretion system protein, partial [Limisphaerales bacterium]